MYWELKKKNFESICQYYSSRVDNCQWCRYSFGPVWKSTVFSFLMRRLKRARSLFQDVWEWCCRLQQRRQFAKHLRCRNCILSISKQKKPKFYNCVQFTQHEMSFRVWNLYKGKAFSLWTKRGSHKVGEEHLKISILRESRDIAEQYIIWE